MQTSLGIMRAATLAVVFALATTAACSQSDPSRQSVEIEISGALDQDALERLRRADLSKASRILVSSPGGDPTAAVEIAKILKSSNRPIIIDGVCGSACLMIAIIDNGSVEFTPGSVLILHNTATSTYLMASATYPAMAAQKFLPPMQAEQAWASDNGIDARLLLLPQMMIDTLCLVGPSGDNPEDYKSFAYGSTYKGWSPSRTLASQLGMKAKGAWAFDAAQIATAMGAKWSAGSTESLVLLQPSLANPAISSPNMEAVLRAIPVCEN